jgi:hypothetical protein
MSLLVNLFNASGAVVGNLRCKECLKTCRRNPEKSEKVLE